MFLNLDKYHLDAHIKSSIDKLTGGQQEMTLSRLWSLMDEAWSRHGCSNKTYDPARYAAFYSDPVWTINGIYTEEDPLSQRIRTDIVNQVRGFEPDRVLDWGGGIGTIARMIAQQLPSCKIHILEPYPSQLGILMCSSYKQVHYVPYLSSATYDYIVCTDVLEHIIDPIQTIDEIISSLDLGGYVLFANCFHPVIKCHLPSTFYLRYGFRTICRSKGLCFLRYNPSSYSEVFQKTCKAYPQRLQDLIILTYRLAYPVIAGIHDFWLSLKSILKSLLNRPARPLNRVR